MGQKTGQSVRLRPGVVIQNPDGIHIREGKSAFQSPRYAAGITRIPRHVNHFQYERIGPGRRLFLHTVQGAVSGPVVRHHDAVQRNSLPRQSPQAHFREGDSTVM